VFWRCRLVKLLTPLTPSVEKSNCAYPGSHATRWRCRGSPSRRRHRLSHPLQCLSTSRAFRLTPGRAWSIDTPSHMHTSMARAEVPARALPRTEELACAARTVSMSIVRASAFVRHPGSPSPQSAPRVASIPCPEQPSTITVGPPAETTTAAAPLPLAPRP